MKKIANYLIALAVAAFTFTSCEDVPSPFGTVVQPDSGEEVVIEPTGNGTEADPYNVAAVLEYISGLGVGVQSDKEFYVKGIISEVKEVQTTGIYGNATYWISDDADGKANKFYIYRGYGLGGKKFTEGATPVQAGDNVVIKSKVMNYNGTYETVQNNCIIVELNGTKDSGGGGDTPTSDLGTKDAPITVAKALEAINKLADSGETGEAYVKGTISKVQSYNSQYKSITYYISDDGKETNELQVYSGKGLNGADFAAKEDLAAGDVVVIKGKLKKFVKNETITPEINQSSEIISLTKGSGGGGDTPSGDVKKVTVQEFLAAAESTDVWYELTGTIEHLEDGTYKNSTQYGNFDLVDETGKVYVYGVLAEKGGSKGQFATLMADKGIKDGCKITIIGNRGAYKGDAQVANAYFVKVEAGSGSDTPSGNTGLEQSFEAGKGDFTIEDKSIGEGITYVWSEDTKNKYMKASAYKGGCIAAESWLVSPAFSLKGITAPVMTFNNACNQVKEGTITDHIKVMVYDGANWTEASISGMPDGKSWTFVDSTVDLKSVAGKTNVKVAFKYISTSAVAPTWEIKNVSIK